MDFVYLVRFGRGGFGTYKPGPLLDSGYGVGAAEVPCLAQVKLTKAMLKHNSTLGCINTVISNTHV